MVEISRRQFLASSITAMTPLIISSRAYASNPSAWRHLRDWNQEEFNKYSQWVGNIYNFKRNGTNQQKTAKMGRIIDDNEMNLLNREEFLEEGNRQINQSDMNLMTSITHCGNFPMLLKLYYSYRRGLPANIAKIRMARGGDIRYSQGNHPTNNIPSMPFNGDFREYILTSLQGKGGGYNFVTGNFRTSPELEGTDSLPIKISREFLKPGIVAYNANGHCLVVGKVAETGEVHFLDAHPDRSITFNQTLSAIPAVTAFSENSISRCYDGFKITRLSRVINNRVVPFTNNEMRLYGFSLDQYEAMAKIRRGEKISGEVITNFPDFVRKQLQISKENPIGLLHSTAAELGEMFRERAAFVQESWEDVLSNGPITFPNNSQSENIYQAHGRWEVWSSPSSDVDRKQKYNYLATRLEQIVSGFPNSQEVDYSGFSSIQELVNAIVNTKNQLFESEKIEYKTSRGEKIKLSLLDIEERLFDLSFNPNHPPELRWGAPEHSKKRENMILINTPLRTGEKLGVLESYELERGLRYYPQRQEGPTSLKPEDNPKSPPFKKINERLKEYLIGEVAQADIP